MRRMRAKALSVPVACALVVAACGKKTADEAAPPTVAEVSTAVLANGAIDRTLTAYGAAEFAPGAEATLSAPMEAVVARLIAGAGALVHQGQPVLILQPSAQAKVDLTKAASDAIAARDALARAQRLRASGLDSNADVETALAADVTAQAALKGLRARAAGLVVRSPNSGVVEAVSAAPGDLVAAGASLGKVGRLSDLRLRLGLDPAMIGQVPIGATVHLRPLAGDTLETAGTVRLIDPRLDPQTHFAGVIVTVSGTRLAPGEAVRGEIVLGHLTGPAAPRQAVYYDGDKPYLVVVRGGVAHRRDVSLGPTRGDTVLIASGVQVGERIVTDGGASLDDGAAVLEAPAAKDSPAKEAP